MKSTCFNLPVIGVFVLSLVPWPAPSVLKIACPRDNARIVRRIIETKWSPVLAKYGVRLPLECPFHAAREIFGPQQAAKHMHRPSQWTCGLCGKSFFEEQYLDAHFDLRHRDDINTAEDAVCLADYCDIMRCDVLITQETTDTTSTVNTDVEIWREAAKALTATGPKDIARYTVKFLGVGKLGRTAATSSGRLKDKQRCQQRMEQSSRNRSTACGDDAGDLRQQRLVELQRLKSNCKPEELVKLKTRCERLVRDCIATLLIQLSAKDFREIEEELNRAVCWYLTCDRYWEDAHGDVRSFPWGLLCMIIMVLSLGICLCYYVIWVLFDFCSTDDGSVTSTSITDRSTPSPAHLLRQDAAGGGAGGHTFTEDYYAADKDNEYIYVTYPPDLKKRLLESEAVFAEPQPTAVV